jgi:hypothetical protein
MAYAADEMLYMQLASNISFYMSLPARDWSILDDVVDIDVYAKHACG